MPMAVKYLLCQFKLCSHLTLYILKLIGDNHSNFLKSHPKSCGLMCHLCKGAGKRGGAPPGEAEAAGVVVSITASLAPLEGMWASPHFVGTSIRTAVPLSPPWLLLLTMWTSNPYVTRTSCSSGCFYSSFATAAKELVSLHDRVPS